MSLRGTWGPAPGHLCGSAPSTGDPGLLCLWDGEWLWPRPGLCAGETPQETGLAKWPPFPFLSLGHECAVSLPEAAQGGWPPCGAPSVLSWFPQTLRGPDWARTQWVSGLLVYVCVYMRGGRQSRTSLSTCLLKEDDTRSGTGGRPVCGVLISTFFPVSAWLMTV